MPCALIVRPKKHSTQLRRRMNAGGREAVGDKTETGSLENATSLWMPSTQRYFRYRRFPLAPALGGFVEVELVQSKESTVKSSYDPTLDKMAQRVTLRKRQPYNTTSNRRRVVKTPGGKLVLHHIKKLAVSRHVWSG